MDFENASVSEGVVGAMCIRLVTNIYVLKFTEGAIGDSTAVSKSVKISNSSSLNSPRLTRVSNFRESVDMMD